MIDITGATLKSYTTYLAERAASTTGVSMSAGLNTAGNAVVGVNPLLVNVKDVGAKGDSTNGVDGTDDTAFFLEAIEQADKRQTAVYIPGGFTKVGDVYTAKRYKITDTLDLSTNNVKMVGDNKTSVILDFSSQSSGPGVRIGRTFDGHLQGFSVLNAYGNCLEVATVGSTGPQAFAANGRIMDLSLRGSRNGWGFFGHEFYMYGMDNIRSQLNALGGFKMDGYSTTLGISRCWATANLGDGWDISNATYSGMFNCGTDDNDGYGYKFQDVHMAMVGCGAENNDKSAVRCYYDSGSSSLVKGIMLDVRNFLTIGNNAGAHSGMGYLLELAAASNSSPNAGIISLHGWRDAGSPSGNAVSGNGTYRVVAPAAANVNAVTWETAAGGFSKTSDGATDHGGNLPVNISGANTTIGTLKPKQKNGLGSFGGLLVITASKNNRGSSYKGCCTVLSVSFGAGSSADIDVIQESGYAGAAADEGAYDYSLDYATGALRATVKGSTTTGNCYFDVACLGDVTFTPA